jgi:hypothetical protein
VTIRGIAFGALAVLLGSGTQALAQSDVRLGTAVFVERSSENARILEPATRLSPGDRVVTVLSWHRDAPSGRFMLTNPLPRSIYYQGSASGDEQVSADGGRTWGRLGSLRIGSRLVTPEDVTHVRWQIAANAPSGTIAYSAIVR